MLVLQGDSCECLFLYHVQNATGKSAASVYHSTFQLHIPVAMARRRRKDSNLVSLAMDAHWGVAATLAVAAVIAFEIALPALLGRSPILEPVASVLAPLGWGFAGLFGVIALINLARQYFNNRADTSLMSGADMDFRRFGEKPNLDLSASNPVASEPSLSKPGEWSLELLQAIDWKRFEEVVAAYFRSKNLRCETQSHGPDGGVDMRLHSPENDTTLALVQCKAWKNMQVGVKPVRELLGVMTHEKVARGYFMVTGEFSQDAKAFAATQNITLFSGKQFLDLMLRQPMDIQTKLLAVATEDDYLTPTCASCGVKMKDRGRFWGCVNFPRCRTRIQIAGA